MQNTKRAGDESLGTEPIGRLILRMGIPGLIAQLINLLYNLVDRMYIGRIQGSGALALTGVGVTLPILQIISAFACLAGNGGAPLAAIQYGRGDKDRAEKILGGSAFLIGCFSVVLTAVFLIFRKPFLYLVGASDATYPYADAYIVIYLIGTCFVQVTLGLNPFITAQGESRVAMFSILIGAAINIALDPVFIFVLGMGVRGAAIATVISQAASAVWILSYLMKKTTILRLKRKNLRPSLRIIGSISALGVSPFIMSSTESLISIVLLSGLQKYGGDLYVGSLTILQSVMQLTSIPLNGFSGGVSPIISYNYGAGKPERVRAVFRRLLLIMVSVSALIALSAMLIPRFYGALFTSDAELIALTGKVLPIFICGMLVFGAQMACQTSFMALGQAKVSLLIALLRKVLLLAPLAAILPAVTGNVMSIYYAEPIADVTSATICFITFLLVTKPLIGKITK